MNFNLSNRYGHMGARGGLGLQNVNPKPVPQDDKKVGEQTDKAPVDAQNKVPARVMSNRPSLVYSPSIPHNKPKSELPPTKTPGNNTPGKTTSAKPIYETIWDGTPRYDNDGILTGFGGPIRHQVGVTVGRGDNLWGIAQGRLGSGASAYDVLLEVARLADLNGISNPNRIFVGQEIMF